MGEVILDALKDTLILFPFLFVLYLLIELMEHKTGVGKPRRALSGKAAPLLGTGLGLVPMCGFSVMAAKLYEHRHVTLGTLVAVFTATNDEALLVLLLSAGTAGGVHALLGAAALVGCKFVLGVFAGYFLDLFFAKETVPLPEHHEHDHEHEHEHEHDHEHDHEHEHEHEHGAEGDGSGECGCAELSPCEHKHENKLSLYLWSPLLHALQVAAFVLLVNFAFGTLFYLLGEEKVVGFLQGTGYWYQPLVCAFLGAVPNCAASVVLAEVYAIGGIGFGGLLGGLVVNAGLGYLILFRKNTWKRGLAIFAGMLLFGIAVGYCANAVQLALVL